MGNLKAEQVFQTVYDRLSIEYENVIPRDAFHREVYRHIVEQCAMIATAHSPAHTDVGEIVRKTMEI